MNVAVWTCFVLRKNKMHDRFYWLLNGAGFIHYSNQEIVNRILPVYRNYTNFPFMRKW